MAQLLLPFGTEGSWQLSVGHGSISYPWELNIDFIFTSLSLLLISTRQSGRWQSITKGMLNKYQEFTLPSGLGLPPEYDSPSVRPHGFVCMARGTEMTHPS